MADQTNPSAASRLNDACGDTMKDKTSATIRVVFQNVSQIPIHAYQQKNEEIFEFVRASKLDVLCLAETNIRWDHVQPRDQWSERTRQRLPRSKHAFSYNTHEDKRDPRIYGGAGVVVTEQLAARTFQNGIDQSGMGRWCWTLTEGKGDKLLRVISAYRPCRSTEGSTTVWSQQVRALAAAGREEDPHEAWSNDLANEIRKWRTEGNTLILGVDLNDNVLDCTTARLLESTGLKNAVWDRTGDQARQATQQRNRNNVPIDAIFVSEGVQLEKAGYLGFGEAIPSDHRAVWVDIGFEQVLEVQDALLEEYGKHNISERVQELWCLAKSQGWRLTPGQRLQYDKLLAQTYEIRRYAEKKCRKLRMGAVAWSPDLQHARNVIKFWSLEVKHISRVKVSSSLRQRTKKSVGLDTAATLEQAKQKLSEAYASYYEQKKQHKQARQDYLVEIARQRHDAHDQEYEAALHLLQNRERQREQAGRLRTIFGQDKSMTTKVLFTDEDGRLHECTEQHEIVTTCIRENKRRFSQANGTPCMTGRDKRIMDRIWQPELAAHLVNREGTSPTELDPMIRTLLASLEPIAQDKTELTVEDHRKAWKRQTELTNSEPSSPHFGHYKAAMMVDSLARTDAQLRDVPYQTGHSPRPWQRITDVEILKKAQVFNIEKMRTIQLMDAQFNLNNKRLGRQMMKTAEEAGWLSGYQFGSRKCKSAMSAALNKRLSIDLGFQQKVAIGFCSNDAKSCYDRIVPNFAAAAMIAAGANGAATRSMFKTLRDADHRISTAYGVSDRSYGRGPDCEMHGIGQGNGAGPAIWAVISSVMFNAMLKLGHASQLTTPDGGVIEILGSAFVDDTDLVRLESTGGEGADTEAFKNMVHDWSRLLRVTGGALVPAKSAWWAIQPEFVKGEWDWTDVDTHTTIRIEDGNGVRSEIPYKTMDQPLFTLGVFIDFDGDQTEQMRRMRAKAKDFGGRMRSAQISPEDAKSALSLRFMKTIEYALPMTQLSRQQWRRAMAPALLASLPKMGVSRNFPRALVYGTTSLGGLGITNPANAQLISQIQLAFDEVHRGTQTGKMIECSILALKEELGTGRSIFRYPFDSVGHCATQCWVTGLWQQLQDTSIRIDETTTTAKIQRDGDGFLMDIWLEQGIKGAQLRHLNMVRQKLGVLRLSDIVSANGTRILGEAHDGTIASCIPKRWANQPERLPSGWWREWQRWCKSMCFRGLLLHEPLGRWRRDDGSWRWWKLPYGHDIFDAGTQPLQRYVLRQNSRTRRQLYARRGTVNNLPAGAKRVSVSFTDAGMAWDSFVGLAQPVDELDAPYDPVENLQGDLSLEEAAGAARRSQLLVVSDGSFKGSRGTSASILYDKATTASMMCQTFVPGLSEVHSAYRSELAGIWASLAVIDRMRDLDASCVITIALDGKQAMLQAQEDGLRPGQRDWDVLTEIRELQHRIPATLQWEWVKGHQDDTGKQLTVLEKLNVKVDDHAKQFWTLTESRRRVRRWHTSTNRWRLRLRNADYSHVDAKELHELLQSADAATYWSSKFQWDEDQLTKVDWHTYKKTRVAKKNKEVAKFISKWSSGFVGVNKKLHQVGQRETPKCQFCQQDETTTHVLRCSEHQEAWQTATSELLDRMVRIGTCPRLVRDMRVGLVRWRRKLRLDGPQSYIGWYPLLLGFIHRDWVRQQTQWMTTNECMYPDAGAWAREMVRWIWKVPWAVWIARNAKVHGAEQHPTIKDLRRQVQRMQQSASSDMTASELHLLRDGWNIEYGTKLQMQQWVHSMTAVQAAVKARRRSRSMQAERQAMATWLGIG